MMKTKTTDDNYSEEQQQQDQEEVMATIVRCDVCNHELPIQNLQLHRITCHNKNKNNNRDLTLSSSHQQQQQQQQSSNNIIVTTTTTMDNNNNNNDFSEVAATRTPTDSTVTCNKCGITIPAQNAIIHDIHCIDTLSRQQQQQQQTEQQTMTAVEESQSTTNNTTTRNGTTITTTAAAEAPVAARQEEISTTTTAAPVTRRDDTTTNIRNSVSSSSNNNNNNNTDAINNNDDDINTINVPPSTSLQDNDNDEWSCPRCTLLNPVIQSQCDACGYINMNLNNNNNNNTPSTQNNNSNNDTSSSIQVQVHEVDPRVVSSATTVLSWGLFGGLIGGPVGAFIGGTAGALMAGATQLQQRQRQNNNDNNNNQQRGPQFTFTRIHQTPTGTSVHVTTSSNNYSANNNGRMRTVLLNRDGAGGTTTGNTFADRMILQMLLQNAMNQHGVINVEQMSYEELLERFGVGTEHRRGASEETIQSLPLTRLDQNGIDNLKENQTTCNICLEDFTIGDNMRSLPNCTHVFHKQCIDRWLSTVSSCPICKNDITITDNNNNTNNNTTTST